MICSLSRSVVPGGVAGDEELHDVSAAAVPRSTAAQRLNLKEELMRIKTQFWSLKNTTYLVLSEPMVSRLRKLLQRKDG
ncbi:hypothetical protein JOD55_000498 [Arcanobacterium pluranimalium]|nr:hypothetical protein [Arcanobacterium pluranimalium]